MSAIQAAAPALAIFTPSGGGTSDGLSPTMFSTTGITGIHKHTETHKQSREREQPFIHQCHMLTIY